jgi:ribonuclease R
MKYRIDIEDRNYTKWILRENTTSDEIDNLSEFDPYKNKLFHNDVFEYDAGLSSNTIATVITSVIRNTTNIPGVLILKGDTYGRIKNKFIYKCIPDDRRLPIFLIPYDKKDVGFSKNPINKYVVFKFDNWTDKHPSARLTNSLGDVTELGNFYKYQLFCKSLNTSIQKFNKITLQSIKKQPEIEIIKQILERNPAIEDRTDQTIWNVFTIDPGGCVDYDDAVSITTPAPDETVISIYISNVLIWIETLKLWEYFSDRVATIYLPDIKRPMLPAVLSEGLCSLQAGNTRFAFTMDVHIKNNQITDIKYLNTAINVARNYHYEEHDLLSCDDYKDILRILKVLRMKDGKEIQNKQIAVISNSHDVVAYLMILMNRSCAQQFVQHKNGIYRSVTINDKPDGGDNGRLTEETQRFLRMWRNSCGRYMEFADGFLSHDMLEFDSYIHITSPIRRLVDLLNLIQFHKNDGNELLLELSSGAERFYNNWLERIEYINTAMRAIRKLQNNCYLLEMCTNNAGAMSEVYDGCVFDKIQRDDGLYQYTVYLERINMVSRITLSDEIEHRDIRQFKLYLFEDEDNLKKKIRLQLHI